MSPLPVLLHIGSCQPPHTKAANERFAIHAFDGPVVASKGSGEGFGGLILEDLDPAEKKKRQQYDTICDPNWR